MVGQMQIEVPMKKAPARGAFFIGAFNQNRTDDLILTMDNSTASNSEQLGITRNNGHLPGISFSNSELFGVIPRAVANATANGAVLGGIFQARNPLELMTVVVPSSHAFRYSNSKSLRRDDCVALQTVRNTDADPSCSLI